MSLSLLGAGGTGAVPADTTPPVLESATVATDGVTLTLVFSEPVVCVNGVEAFFDNWTVDCVGNVSITTILYVSGNGTSTVIGTLDNTAPQGSTVTVYNSAGDIEDLSGNAMGTTEEEAVNNSIQTPPALSSATIQSNGTTLRLVFSAAVTGFSSGAEGFALTSLSGGATTVAYSSGNDSTTVDFTISRTVGQPETGGKLAYTAGDIARQSNGLLLANFSNTDVTNDSTQPAEGGD